jgi:Cu2+-exporting ATPase
VRARVAGTATHWAHIGRLVREALARKSMLGETIDRVAAVFIPLVLLLAGGTAWYWGARAGLDAALLAGLSVLVVACPCALALAAPIVLTRASGALLARGVLLTRARALEALDRVTDVVLDKTGTLTTGRLSVSQVMPLGMLSETACLDLARSLEASSRHPVARAFTGAVTVDVESPRSFPGQGIEGRVQGRRVRIGTADFCGELCGLPQPALKDARVFLADEAGWLAAFELADSLRPTAPGFVAGLEAKVHLASGDRPEVVAALARELGIASWAGAMSPEDKYRYIERLQREGRIVAMVGDGLNDAPVLARADVSFAMGSGADAAQLKADVVLMSDSLESISRTLQVAQRSMRLVRQNIAWAIVYNAIALPLAATGWIGPWEAALAMGASSLTVLLNALRPLDPGAEWKASTSSFPSRSPSYS